MVDRSPIRRVALALLLAAAASSPTTHASAQGDRYGAQSIAERRYSEGRQLELEADRDPERRDTLLEQAARKYALAIERDPDLIAAYVHFGYVLYALDRSSEAVKLMRVAYKKEPDNIEVQHQLGLNLMQSGEPDDAVELLSQVSATRNDRPDVEFILGKYFLEERQFEDALRHFERYVELNPADPQGPRALSTLYFGEERFEDALAQMKRVLELDPEDTRAHANMGNALYALERYPEALKAYDIAITRDDSRFDVHYNRGSALYLLDDPAGALTSFQRAAELQPDAFAAWYFVGDSALLAGQPQTALKAFDRVLELKDEYAYGHLGKGQAYARLDQPEKAREHFDTAVSLRSEDPQLRYALSRAHLRLSDLDAALDHAVVATELAPNDILYAVGLGDVLLAMGRDDEAVLVFRNASRDLQSTPAPPELVERVSTGLSLALLARGTRRLREPDADREAIRADFEEVRRIERHPFPARVNLAALELAEGQLEVARKHLERARELDPEAPALRRIEARILVAEGRDDEAGEALDALEAADAMTPQMWHDRGLLLARAGDFDDARKAFERAAEGGVDASRNIALAAFQEGLEEARRGQWRQAQRRFDQAMSHRKAMTRVETTRVELAMAHIAFENGDLERALTLFVEVEEDVADFSKADRARLADDGALDLDREIAKLLYALGRYNDALERIERSNLKLPDIERAIHIHLANTALAEERYDDAERHLRTAIAQGEDTPEVRFNLAVVLYARGDVDDAGEMFSRLARKGKPVAAVLNYAIYLDDVVGDGAEARRYYTRYLELGGPRAEEVQTLLENKRRVFGEAP